MTEHGMNPAKCPHGVVRAVECRTCDEVVCDRCGRTPGVASDGHTPYCHFCLHECTFTREQVEDAAR